MKIHKKKQVVSKILNKELNAKNGTELTRMLIDDPILIDTDKNEDKKRTLGDKLADIVTKTVGSWFFIVIFSLFLFLWMILNYFEVIKIDPYPYILLNLILSCLAALQAPIIMMSQNRAAKKDSLRSLNDYKTDLKSELILETLYEEINDIKNNQEKIIKKLNVKKRK